MEPALFIVTGESMSDVPAVLAKRAIASTWTGSLMVHVDAAKKRKIVFIRVIFLKIMRRSFLVLKK
jgi:hypothetical protein